jgi:hypothetical protein
MHVVLYLSQCLTQPEPQAALGQDRPASFSDGHPKWFATHHIRPIHFAKHEAQHEAATGAL